MVEELFSGNEEYKFNYYGWGVGGHPKFEVIAKMLSELGYKKVVIILDSGKEESKNKDMLEKLFSDYCVKQIPAEDIRDKKHQINKKNINRLLNDSSLQDKYKMMLKEILENGKFSGKAQGLVKFGREEKSTSKENVVRLKEEYIASVTELIEDIRTYFHGE